MKTDPFDVVVAGGGLAGTFAAVAAARRGARVALFEPQGFLGGVATAAMVTVFMGYHVHAEDGQLAPLVRGLFEEMNDRMRVEEGTRDGFRFDDLVLRGVLDDLATEAGVELFFHSLVTGVRVEEDRIVGMQYASKSGLREAQAAVYVDSTGDADLASYAGVPFDIGRAGDGRSQPMTATFQMAGIDPDRLPPSARRNELFREARERGEIESDIKGVGMFPTPRPDVYLFNTSHIYDLSGTDVRDLSRAEVIGRRQIRAITRDLRRHIPGFEKAWLVKTGTKVGVRETRHLQGEYTLAADDVMAARAFPDGIARCSYEIDIHDPDKGATKNIVLKRGTFYEVPYRCLLPRRGPRNVLVACRAISATHEAHASLRIMATTSAMGEAAGVAAQWSLKHGGDVHSVNGETLKEHLLESGIMGHVAKPASEAGQRDTPAPFGVA